MSADATRRASLLFGSMLASLLVLEAGVRLFYPQNLSGWWMVRHASGLVLNRAEGSARHAFRDIAVVYSFGPHHNRKVVRANERVDGRLLLLGDSFAFGWLVADGTTFADRLQARFSHYELVNAAVGGWGTADHVKYLELFCRDLHPSMVYLLMNSYDIDRAANSHLYQLDVHGALGEGPAAGNADMKFVLNKLPVYGWLLEHSHLAQFARRRLLAPAERGSVAAPDAIAADANALGRALFLKLKADSAACGTSLQVFFTGWWQARDGENLTVPFVRRAVAEGFFASNGIAFHDLGETAAMSTLLRDRSRYTIPDDGHPNAAGAELLARAIGEIY